MIKQIRLSTGDEILCEVIEDGEFEVIVRNSLKLIQRTHNGMKFYTFKNFMVYQDRPESIQIIRADHVVSYANPPEDLVEEWRRGLQEMYAHGEEVSIPDELDFLDSGADNIIPFKPIVH